MATDMTGYNCMQSLIHLKRFIKVKRTQGGGVFTFRGQQMGCHVFPFFADLIIRYCTMLEPTRHFDDNSIATLMDRYMNFPEILNLPSGKADLSRCAPEWCIRAAFEQLEPQEMTKTLVPRILYLYRDIPNLNPVRHRAFLNARDEVLKYQFRVNLDDLLLCAFSLSAIAKTSDRFTEQLSTDIVWLRRHIESDAMPIVRSQLSLPRDKYIERAKNQFSGSYTYIKTEPKLIQTYPIVQFEPHYVLPDPHLLMNRVTKHLHDSIYQYFIDNDRKQEYAGSFGGIFKEYIGIILKHCYGDEQVFDIDEIEGLVGPRADWLIISGQNAAIFECKAHRYPRELKQTGSLALLDSFVNDRIGHALSQLKETEKQWETITGAIPKTQVVKNRYKFIVLQESFQFANVMRDFLPDNSTVTKMHNSETYIVDMLDLETVVSSNYANDFVNVFVRWPNRIVVCPSLQQHVRALPGFCFVADNFLEQKFNEFLRPEEL